MKPELSVTTVIAFMGVDGSGKSTLIKGIKKKLKKKYQSIKYIHLRPYLFLTDKSTINKNPHNQKKIKSQFESFLKILFWLFMYKIFFFIKFKKKNQLIIFDRYAHDLLVDKKRYRFNLTKKLTKYILSFFPTPNLWIILTAPINKIEKRKKELSTSELKRQVKSYINFAKSKKNSLIVNTGKNIQSCISLIISKINFNISR
jgi:thymidylate kinase